MKMKQWKTPKLVVLYRSKPEESVLVSCKVFHNDLTHLEGPLRWNSRCHAKAPCKDNGCFSRSVS